MTGFGRIESGTSGTRGLRVPRRAGVTTPALLAGLFSALAPFACASGARTDPPGRGAEEAGTRAAPEATTGAEPRAARGPAATGGDRQAAEAAGQAQASGGETPRVFPGFVPETFDTEPLALLPPAGITLPPELAGDPEGGDAALEVRRELEMILTDRLPEEVRILHSRAPVLGFQEWGADLDGGPQGGFLRSVLGWDGQPGPAGELPPIVGDSVEELGDTRGVRFFLFPRSLTISRGGPFDLTATVEAFLLDARGERVVWAGFGRGTGSLPEGEPDRLVRGVVREAAIAAAADLAARLPGSRTAGGGGGFTDLER